MITEYNLINWLRFGARILNNKECKKKIHRFIYRHYNTDNRTTSRAIYKKYWKCK